jgi:hypothetical protein
VSVPNPNATPNVLALSPTRVRMLRVIALVCATLLLVVAVAAACGGDEGNDDPESTAGASPASDDGDGDGDDDEVVVVMETFTPTPENNTPASVQTRIAQQTAFAETQTAQPDSPSTAPPDITVNPNTPAATIPPNAVKPPDLVLNTSAGAQTGSIGGYQWYDLEFNAGGDFDVPYVALPDNNLEWASDTTAELTVPESPFAVRSTDINVFVYDDNIATPQDAQGQILGDYVFARQTDPVRQETIQGSDITLTQDVEPGNYIFEVTVTWDAPENLEAVFESPLSTQYVFLVTVI